MKVSDVLHCSFPAWYPKFKHITIKSILIPIPPEFLEYLHADGVVLPEGSLNTVDDREPDDDRIEGDELDVNWEAETLEAESPSFPEFDAAVKRGIKALGGVVFPKLNWSAPRDATWISFDKTLKCTCPSDIYLLLKSSEFITHDLTESFIHCEDCEESEEAKVNYQLVLRKWQNLNAGYEFRCFVRENKLIVIWLYPVFISEGKSPVKIYFGRDIDLPQVNWQTVHIMSAICQRNHTVFYEFIRKEKDDIISDIQSFFYHMISLKFPNESYVFDVYRRDQGKLLLLDFNPFGQVTDGLMYTWDELNDTDFLVTSDQLNAQLPAFRYVSESSGVQPNPLSSFGVPRDILDLATGSDPHKLVDLLQFRQQQQAAEDSADEEESPVT